MRKRKLLSDRLYGLAEWLAGQGMDRNEAMIKSAIRIVRKYEMDAAKQKKK